MNKKLITISILAVLTLVGISLTSAVTTTKDNERKESPLYGIRTKLAIGEKLENLRANIEAKFTVGRVFWIPLQWQRNDLLVRERLQIKTIGHTECEYPFCSFVPCMNQ